MARLTPMQNPAFFANLTRAIVFYSQPLPACPEDLDFRIHSRRALAALFKRDY
jgi:hypothetical protein